MSTETEEEKYLEEHFGSLESKSTFDKKNVAHKVFTSLGVSKDKKTSNMIILLVVILVLTALVFIFGVSNNKDFNDKNVPEADPQLHI